jgi:hypothetical protein
MPEPHNDPRDPLRQGDNGQKAGAQPGQYGQGQSGQGQSGQGEYGQGQQPGSSHQQGQSGQQNPEDLKRRARNSEADQQMRNAGREVAERFADRSREQIDRYEKAFGEFWKVAESDGFMPFARSIARAHMEVAGLASRRAKAYAEFPVQLSQCQSTNEMLNRQMRFVSDMINDWQETVSRVTRTWGEGGPQQMMAQFADMQDGGQGQQSYGQNQGQHQGKDPGQQQYGGGPSPGQGTGQPGSQQRSR